MDFKSIAQFIKPLYTEFSKDIWTDSTFEWIKTSSTCEKGNIGENIVKNYHILKQDVVEKRDSVENDILINGNKVEIKLSCLNKSGYFKWLQIRIDDDFQYLYLVSVYPDSIKVYTIPKSVLLELVEKNIVKSQHGGKRNQNYSIKYLGIKANSIPQWLSDLEIIIKNN